MNIGEVILVTVSKQFYANYEENKWFVIVPTICIFFMAHLIICRAAARAASTSAWSSWSPSPGDLALPNMENEI